MDGFFLENGPLRMNGTLTYNPYHWSRHANVVYIDQPAGTGYSVGKYSSTNQEVVEHFMDFLHNFYQTYPEFIPFDLYLSGESFAGIWIPYFADAILKNNDGKLDVIVAAAADKKGFNLKGLVIGNGWMDPRYQYPAYLVFAQTHGLLKGSDLTVAQGYMDLCKKELKLNPYLISSQHCEKIMDVIMQASVKDGGFCLNKYDIRLRDHGPNEGCGMSWPPGVYDMAKYLSLHDTQKGLHVESQNYSTLTECNGRVYSSLASENTLSSATLFPHLLSKIETEPEEWRLDDEMVGTITKDRNLSLYTIFDGSHMSAFDQPEATLDMISRILNIRNDTAADTPPAKTVESQVPVDTLVPTVETILPEPTKIEKVVASIKPEWPEAEAPPQPSDPPISLLTGFYIMFAVLGVVVGAVYVMKIIRQRKPPQWDSVPEDEEDLEMEERRRLE
ncbi:Cell death protease [Terramyces sp. JEL0728]|nr:Cell death protease [Terramyces sp. JEL0728]